MNKKILFLIILIGFIIRLVLLNSNQVIEIDGSNYLRLGENLISGKGYVDLRGGINVLFPPAYPIVSGITGILIGNIELAGRIVSLIFGIGLIFIMYLIGKKFYNEKVGLICGALTALYPVLTYISGVTYTESLYLFLIASGLYLGWLALENKRSYWRFLILGLVFGLAYLTRSEGIIFVFVLIFLILIFRSLWRYKIKNISFLLIGFILISLPYWIFLYSQMGFFTFGARSTAEFLEEAYIATQSENVTEYELNNLNVEFGADDFSDNYVGLFNYILRDPLKFFRRYFNNLYKEQTNVITSLYPLIFILIAFAGIILGEWNLIRKKKELYLLLFFLAPLIALPISYVSPRMILSSLLVLIIWTGNGIRELDKWIKRNFNLNYKLVLIFILLVFFIGNFLISSMTISDTKFRYDSREPGRIKETGFWIKENTDASVIMVREPRISFYASTSFEKVPLGDVTSVTEKSCEKNVDLIVFTRKMIERFRPNLVCLLDGKNTPKNLKLVKKFDDEVIIYKPIC